MKTKEYIYYKTDDSFDYLSPRGTDTCYCKGLHGFEISYDDNDIPILDSIEGFGHMLSASESASNWDDFLKFLEKNEKFIMQEEGEGDSEEVFDELKKKIKEMILCKM